MTPSDDPSTEDRAAGPAPVEPMPIEIDRDEVIEFGAARPGRWSGRPAWQRWSPLALVAVVAAGLAVHAALHRPDGGSAAPAPSASVVAAPSEVGPVPPAPTGTAPGVVDVGHPLLGVTGSWNLFALGDTDVVRIEPAKGRIVTTPFPALKSSGPVSFVAGPSWVMVRPLDHVPGYLVRDDSVAAEQNTPFAYGGALLPGPDADHLWLQGNDNDAIRLVDVRGHFTGTSIKIPDDLVMSGLSAGGYPLMQGTGGTYLARPSGLTRITTGALLAVGPDRFLTRECDAEHRCVSVVTDRAGGTGHPLPGLSVPPASAVGAISPDGRTAALLEPDDSGRSVVHLIDLGTGADRLSAVSVDESSYQNVMVWSPDGTWLFVTDAEGGLHAVNRATGRAGALDMKLPPVTQLAIRP
jgi:hypothetical protein